MIYKGEFRDINDNKFTIEINTNNGTDTQEIILGETPIVIEYEGGNTLYKPYKCSTATISFVSSNYLFDLYASTAQQNKVTLKDSWGDIVWVGYLTPNLYNMGYEKVIEDVELEAIDALATLQYFDYTTIGNSKDIVTFHNLIIHLLNKCNSYTNFYFPKSYNNDYFIDKLHISEEDFYDEDGDAMTYQEVLEEVCKYLGLTCTSFGNEIYFLDYDSIKQDRNDYYKVNLNTGTKTSVTLSSNKSINGQDYAENGGQISLDNVYNKVTVKDSLYGFDVLLPSMFDDAINITADSDQEIEKPNENKFGNTGYYGEILEENGNRVMAFIAKIDGIFSKYTDYVAEAIQYFNSPNYICQRYEMTQLVNYFAPFLKSQINYTDTRLHPGAYIAKIFGQKLTKEADEIEDDIKSLINEDSKLEAYLASNDINKFDYDEYILLTNPILYKDGFDYHIQNDDAIYYPYITSNIKNASCLFGGENAYILITGSYILHPYLGLFDHTFPFPTNASIISSLTDKRSVVKEDIYLLCKLQWGNKYWNGTEWTSTDSTFKLEFRKKDGDYKCNTTFYKDIEIKSNVVFNTGIGEKGYVIKCPTNGVVSGMPKLTIYKPIDVKLKEKDKITPLRITMGILKNFEIKAVLGDVANLNNQDSDTEYFNVINEEYVNELETIEFNICTWDNKSPNYSAVGYGESGNINFLDKVSYDGQNLRMEEHLIRRLVNQYSTPSIILNLNLKNNGILPYTLLTDKFINNKSFVIDSYSIDFKYNKNMIRLIEKK